MFTMQRRFLGWYYEVKMTVTEIETEDPAQPDRYNWQTDLDLPPWLTQFPDGTASLVKIRPESRLYRREEDAKREVIIWAQSVLHNDRVDERRRKDPTEIYWLEEMGRRQGGPT